MKLKTLKDLDFNNLEFREKRTSEYLIENLKQEAVKWVKGMDNDEQFGEANNREFSRVDYLLQQRAIFTWIKHFFNLKESDLE